MQVGVGDLVEVLDRQPDCGCDACDTGSADLLDTVDNAFVLALSGGVYVCAGAGRGWSAVAGRVGERGVDSRTAERVAGRGSGRAA